ncbi:DnaJ of sub C member 19 [Perkinsus chesapeaki]|uniref:DnaJ of sub C member 19 n=1 Tax=Perkinsus chesapeaki TaxID=330153 RepID=A0A7J6LTG6_PERCH|nr:DnaJ of sub C member 19 [Perkinsus chesapeaki]
MGATLSRPTLYILPYLAIQSSDVKRRRKLSVGSPPPIGFYKSVGPVNIGTIPYVNMNVTSDRETPDVVISVGELPKPPTAPKPNDGPAAVEYEALPSTARDTPPIIQSAVEEYANPRTGPPPGIYKGELRVIERGGENIIDVSITVPKNALSPGLTAVLFLYAKDRTVAIGELKVPLLYKEGDCWMLDLISMPGSEQVKEDTLDALRDITGVDSLTWDSMLMCYRKGSEWHTYLGSPPAVDVPLRRQPFKRKSSKVGGDLPFMQLNSFNMLTVDNSSTSSSSLLKEATVEISRIDRSISNGEEYLFMKGRLLEEYRDIMLDKLAVLREFEQGVDDNNDEHRGLVNELNSSSTVSDNRSTGEQHKEEEEEEEEGNRASVAEERSEENPSSTKAQEDIIINNDITSPMELQNRAKPAELTSSNTSESRAPSIRELIESLRTPSSDLTTTRKALTVLVPLANQDGAGFTSSGGIQILKDLIEQGLALDLVAQVFCSLCDDNKVSTAIVASIVDLGLIKAILLRLSAAHTANRFVPRVREGIARLLAVDGPRVSLEISNIIAGMPSEQDQLEVPLSLLRDCLREEIIPSTTVISSLLTSLSIHTNQPQSCINLCFTLRRLVESGSLRRGRAIQTNDSERLVDIILSTFKQARKAPRVLVEGVLLFEVLNLISPEVLRTTQGIVRAEGDVLDSRVQKAGLWSIARMCPHLLHPGSVDLQLANTTVEVSINCLAHHPGEQGLVLVATGCLLEAMRCLGDDEEAWETIVRSAFDMGAVNVLETIIVDHGPGNPRLALMAGELIRTIRRRIPCDKSPMPSTTLPQDKPFGDVPDVVGETLKQGDPLPIGRGILKSSSSGLSFTPLEEGRSRTVSFKTPSPSDTRIYHPTPQSDTQSCPSPPSSLDIDPSPQDVPEDIFRDQSQEGSASFFLPIVGISSIMFGQLFGLGVGALAIRQGMRWAATANVVLPKIPWISLRALKGLDGFESKMSRSEACKVLNLSIARASKENVRKAHRELLLANHPDKGGSTFIATKINEAKDAHRYLPFTELLDGFTQTCSLWYSVSKRLREHNGDGLCVDIFSHAHADLRKLSELLPRRLTSLRVSLPAPESEPYHLSSDVIEAITWLTNRLPHLRVLELFTRNKSQATVFDNRAITNFRERVDVDCMSEDRNTGLTHLLIHRCTFDEELGSRLGELCPTLRTLCLTGCSHLTHPDFDVLPTDPLGCLTSLMLGGSVPGSFGFDAWIKRQLLDDRTRCSLTYIEARGSDLDVTLETMLAVRRRRKDVRLDFSMMDLVTTLFSIVDHI